jgi:hypothetical protein
MAKEGYGRLKHGARTGVPAAGYKNKDRNIVFRLASGLPRRLNLNAVNIIIIDKCLYS